MNCFVLKVLLTILCLIQSSVTLTHTPKARLLTSYLPASMQALAYYIDQLQYEQQSTVTVEPPFDANLNATVNVTHTSSTTTTTTTSTAIKGSTTKRPTHLAWSVPSWWLPKTTTETALYTSRKPLTAATTTTTKTTTTTTKSSTKRPSNIWQAPSWWQSATTTTTTTTTLKPSRVSTTSGWWKPPSWWQKPLANISPSTTEASPRSTPAHAPAIFAPLHNTRQKNKPRTPEGYEIFCEFDENDTETLAILPYELIRDIRTETEHDQFTNDVESLDNFLRLYDDNYGRDAFSNVDAVLDRWSSTSTAGKKRVPPNKPYVEFLLVYDLLKRDAKAENLSKYEGYSADMLQELHELSDTSAPRQLYTLFKRMLDRRDIQRSDVVARIQMLVKELGNSQSETAKALQPIPAMKFLL